MNIRAVIFDKDGTLFDFQDTWGVWTGSVLARIAGSDAAMFQSLAQALKYDVIAKKVIKNLFSKKLNIFCQPSPFLAFLIKVFPVIEKIRKSIF